MATGIVSCYCVISINGCTSANVTAVGHWWPYNFHLDCVVDAVAVAMAIGVRLLANHSEWSGCLCVLCVSVGTRLVEQDFSFVLLLKQNLWTKMFLLFSVTKLVVYQLDCLINFLLVLLLNSKV